jgi:hypothetical protein
VLPALQALPGTGRTHRHRWVGTFVLWSNDKGVVQREQHQQGGSEGHDANEDDAGRLSGHPDAITDAHHTSANAAQALPW